VRSIRHILLGPDRHRLAELPMTFKCVPAPLAVIVPGQSNRRARMSNALHRPPGVLLDAHRKRTCGFWRHFER